MTTIQYGAGKKSDSQAFLVSDVKSLPAILSKQEQAFVSKRIKKDFDTAILQRVEEMLFFVRLPKKLTDSSLEKARQKGAEFCKILNQNKKKTVSINGSEMASLAFSEGLALANYQFLKYLKEADSKKSLLEQIYVKADKATINELNILIEATFWARDLVNEPVSFLNAPELANQLTKMGEQSGLKVEVLDQLKIETLKMGGLLAVNKGSVDPATFTILEWKPKNAKNKKPIVLVGKGVVYDTGGLSLKPTPNSMDVMKSDMGGAAAVSCAIYAVAKAKLPVHVVCLVPATDNRPGGNAYAPGDIVTMFDGTTVEVLNTDAEGRMLLADALAYAKKYNPELVFDAATLTGSALRAVGSFASVIVGNASEKVFSKIEKSAYNVHERVARFPFWDDYAEEMKSKIADLNNLGGANAGAITAGKFLEHFTDYPWVHFDIAGPAWADKDSGYITQGGSGVGVRLFYDFIKNY